MTRGTAGQGHKPLQGFTVLPPGGSPRKSRPGTPAAVFGAGAQKTEMDAKSNLKAKLPSRHATEGPDRAPHRAFYYAMGLSNEQIHQPFVGVATCWNEAAPCNIALMRQAQAVKKGVAAVGGTPREFCTITVTDGIAMGHAGMKSSLPSREVIADSVELTMRGH
jgi:dihydroxy-acid dehydratase